MHCSSRAANFRVFALHKRRDTRFYFAHTLTANGCDEQTDCLDDLWNDMSSDERILEAVVIGAGLAGLTCAYMLRKRGIEAILLEKDPDIGGSWARRHPKLTLNTHRDLSSLPKMKYPPGTAAFPKRDAVVAHLQAFARLHVFDIRYDVEVGSVLKSNGHFLVSTNDGQIFAKNVIVATGRDADPVLPAWPGLNEYQGKVVHAADFGDAHEYVGRSVLVVGGGNSGFDILNHLSRVKTGPVWFSVRRGPSILPKRLGGLAIHRLSPLMAMFPTRFVDSLIAGTQFLAFGRRSILGFPAGRADAATRLANEQIAIPVDDGCVAAIRAGRITVVPPIVEFTTNGVQLSDERLLSPDVVIAAAGYASSLTRFLSTFDVLDQHGYPNRKKGAVSHPVPGLWFIGMTPTLTSFFRQTQREASLIAATISEARNRPG